MPEPEMARPERAACLLRLLTELELDGACTPTGIENDPRKADRASEDDPTSGNVTLRSSLNMAHGTENARVGPVRRARTALRM